MIELDGGQHAEQTGEDTERTAEIAVHGYRVIRFWNNDVLGNIDGVLMRIVEALGVSPTSPRPSPPPWAEREQRKASLDGLLDCFDAEKHRRELMLDVPPVGQESF